LEFETGIGDLESEINATIPNSYFIIPNSTMRLVLASASPRRAELLRAAGFSFETVAVDVDERVRAGESAEAYVRRLGADKSAAGLAARRGCATGNQLAALKDCATGARGFGQADDFAVLGADTAVVVDGEILGKPRDDDDATVMLRRLSGRRHDVMTGVSLRRGARELGRVETTAVFFAELGNEAAAWYIQSGEGRDKAGAYAIQGLASRFILRIEGSYSNVVGLPIRAVVELLAQLG
jgi:septum formation protein